jgi:tetratricopeptide (TPR) repeat protein
VKTKIILTAAVALLGASGLALYAGRPALTPRPDRPVATARAPYDAALLPKTIAFYEWRVKRDSQPSIDLAKLGTLYLQRSRETGNVGDAKHAEAVARRSLSIRTTNNGAAFNCLAHALMTQHRFTESLAVARRNLAMHPTDQESRRMIAELNLELGNYPDAERALEAFSSVRVDPSMLALRSRLMEVKGRTSEALALIRLAQSEADRNRYLPAENAAWYHLRVGDLLLSTGRVGEAETAYRGALALYPLDRKSLFGMGRVAAARRDWNGVVDWCSRSAALDPDPPVLELLGDAYLALGKKDLSAKQYALVDEGYTMERRNGGSHDRLQAMFLADHNLRLDEALRLAIRDMKVRQDVYAYDTLAWTSYKQGQLAEADAAMAKALALGTKDARLFFHAAEIARARGSAAKADSCLQESRRINPALYVFSPVMKPNAG